MTINGVQRVIACNPADMLCDVLRSAGYTEVKRGCDTGNCGVCTVWLDGVPVPSCSVFAGRAEGRNITTVRGVEKKLRNSRNSLLPKDQTSVAIAPLVLP